MGSHVRTNGDVAMCYSVFFETASRQIFSASIPHLRVTGKEKPGVTIRYFILLLDLCEGQTLHILHSQATTTA